MSIATLSGDPEQGSARVGLVGIFHHCSNGVIFERSKYHHRFGVVGEDPSISRKYEFYKTADERSSEEDLNGYISDDTKPGPDS